MPLASSYNPHQYQDAIFDRWARENVGSPEAQLNAQHKNPESTPTFTILMPPPNLTGTLHAGHAFQHYVMDTLIRIARQYGQDSLWYPGVDHAGIQLEGVIDKLINKGEFNDKLTKLIPDTVPQNEYAWWLKEHDRDTWLELAWSKVNEWRDNQRRQSRILGDTPDYSRNLFTLDPRATRMVMHAFKAYWEDGLIYKGEYMINWSIGLQTALSDFQQDVEWVKQNDPFITFVYTLQSVRSSLLESRPEWQQIVSRVEETLSEIPVSTVRPETIFADVAVAIHPDRLLTYLGSDELAHQIHDYIAADSLLITLEIPALKTHNVRLVISDKVDNSFGTGALKITPAHDQFDYELYKELSDNGILEKTFQSAIARSGKLTAICGDFEGYSVTQGRMLTIKRLLESGHVPVKDGMDEVLPDMYIADDQFAHMEYRLQIAALREMYPHHNINWDYEHNVLYCERSKTPIEPLISTEYFLSYHRPSRSLTRNLREIGLDGIQQTSFYPTDLKQRAVTILEDVHDWCISRSLIWGHQIPVWYNLDLNPGRILYQPHNMDEDITINIDGTKQVVKGRDMVYIGEHPPQLPGNWVRETQVFDTWFSSCLWPLTTLNFYDTIHGAEHTDFDRYYPTDVMTTGIDIFYAWIVRMIVLCTYWTGHTPFKHLVVTPTILDEKGKKMSKSLGNGLQPEEAINKHGSDSLRLAVLSGMIPGRNMRLGGSATDTVCTKYRNFQNKIWNIARFFEHMETAHHD